MHGEAATTLRPAAFPRFVLRQVLPALLLFATVGSAAAQQPAVSQQIDGVKLGAFWIIPFAGMLLSIALLPLLAPSFWHRRYGAVSAFWALMFVIPAVFQFGAQSALHELLHTLLLEYVPFLILISALFCVTGNIHIAGNLHGSPKLNTGILALGTLAASIMGTTGASMLLIRPLIRANDDRRHNAHVVIFFIFLVGNIGGSLTPLGDPPLFLGFLQGVSFFWTTTHLFLPTVLAVALVLALFFAIDHWYYAKEGHEAVDITPDSKISFQGGANFFLLAGILGAVLLSGSVKMGAVEIFSTHLEVQNLLRDAALIGLTLLSFAITRSSIRVANEFSLEPVKEVAQLFAGIFVTIIPVIIMLKAGRSGPLSPIINAVTASDGQPVNSMYFWLTGILSSFLDNAPTYLVFFNAAGGNAVQLMGPMAATLAAISAGAVFMGANTYIGNAPNFMVKSIAESRGVKMPGFFGYMLWSGCCLLPVWALLNFLFFV
jgi:Na+/H+ antiporter NhaD/arsenite permease-like protein